MNALFHLFLWLGLCAICAGLAGIAAGLA